MLNILVFGWLTDSRSVRQQYKMTTPVMSQSSVILYASYSIVPPCSSAPNLQLRRCLITFSLSIPSFHRLAVHTVNVRLGTCFKKCINIAITFTTGPLSFVPNRSLSGASSNHEVSCRELPWRHAPCFEISSITSDASRY